VLSLKDAWIKASVEHVTIELNYMSSRTKGEYTTREVEPDFYGWNIKRNNHGLWGLCRLRNDIRCFKEDSVLNWKYIGHKFTPLPEGRYMELIPEYNNNQLKDKKWIKSQNNGG